MIVRVSVRVTITITFRISVGCPLACPERSPLLPNPVGATGIHTKDATS